MAHIRMLDDTSVKFNEFLTKLSNPVNPSDGGWVSPSSTKFTSMRKPVYGSPRARSAGTYRPSTRSSYRPSTAGAVPSPGFRPASSSPGKSFPHLGRKTRTSGARSPGQVVPTNAARIQRRLLRSYGPSDVARPTTAPAGMSRNERDPLPSTGDTSPDSPKREKWWDQDDGEDTEFHVWSRAMLHQIQNFDKTDYTGTLIELLEKEETETDFLTEAYTVQQEGAPAGGGSVSTGTLRVALKVDISMDSGVGASSPQRPVPGGHALQSTAIRTRVTAEESSISAGPYKIVRATCRTRERSELLGPQTDGNMADLRVLFAPDINLEQLETLNKWLTEVLKRSSLADGKTADGDFVADVHRSYKLMTGLTNQVAKYSDQLASMILKVFGAFKALFRRWIQQTDVQRQQLSELNAISLQKLRESETFCRDRVRGAEARCDDLEKQLRETQMELESLRTQYILEREKLLNEISHVEDELLTTQERLTQRSILTDFEGKPTEDSLQKLCKSMGEFLKEVEKSRDENITMISDVDNMFRALDAAAGYDANRANEKAVQFPPDSDDDDDDMFKKKKLPKKIQQMPPYFQKVLRSIKDTSDEELSPIDVARQIDEIYQEKRKADLADDKARKQRSELAEFIYELFLRSHGTKKIAIRRLFIFARAVQKLRHHNKKLEYFSRFSQLSKQKDWKDLNVLNFYLDAFATFTEGKGGPTIADVDQPNLEVRHVAFSRVQEGLRKLFPLTLGGEDERDIVDAILANCEPHVVDLTLTKGKIKQLDAIPLDEALDYVMKERAVFAKQLTKLTSKIFEAADDNGDGVLTFGEFKTIIRRIDPSQKDRNILKLFRKAMDENEDDDEGALSPAQFSNIVLSNGLIGVGKIPDFMKEMLSGPSPKPEQ
eukprot:Rmarinus@m.29119